MSSLYNINNDLQEAMSLAYDDMIENGGEFNDELIAAVDNLQMDRTTKIDNTAKYIRHLNNTVQGIADDIKAAVERAEYFKKKCAWVEKNLASQLNGEKYESGEAIITWRKSDVLRIDDESAVPAEWINTTEKVVVKSAVDKARAKKAIKAGEEIAGLSVEYKNTMKIK